VFLVRNSFTPRSGNLGGLFKLNQYSGSEAHEAVKAIGHFFGKSFKPWEAVKWTRAVANAGRALLVAGCVLTFVLQIKEDADAAQLEKDLRESRAAVRSGFNDAAHVVQMHYDKATASYLTSTLTSEIDVTDKQLTDLRDLKHNTHRPVQKPECLASETRQMIRDLHADRRTSL
jgi:hypothetical protein